MLPISDHHALLQICALSHVFMYAFMSNVRGYGLAEKKKNKFQCHQQDHCEQGCYMKRKYFGPFPQRNTKICICSLWEDVFVYTKIPLF